MNTPYPLDCAPDSPDLTFALEMIGARHDSARVRATLLPYLSHPDPIVREGAIYGIARHLDDDTRAALGRMAESDDSGEIRTTAREALEP